MCSADIRGDKELSVYSFTSVALCSTGLANTESVCGWVGASVGQSSFCAGGGV